MHTGVRGLRLGCFSGSSQRVRCSWEHKTVLLCFWTKMGVACLTRHRHSKLPAQLASGHFSARVLCMSACGWHCGWMWQALHCAMAASCLGGARFDRCYQQKFMSLCMVGECQPLARPLLAAARWLCSGEVHAITARHVLCCADRQHMLRLCSVVQRTPAG